MGDVDLTFYEAFWVFVFINEYITPKRIFTRLRVLVVLVKII